MKVCLIHLAVKVVKIIEHLTNSVHELQVGLVSMSKILESLVSNN